MRSNDDVLHQRFPYRVRDDEGSLTHRRIDPSGVCEPVSCAAYAKAAVLIEAWLVFAAA